jgi:2-dehydro-3-deoxyphosphogluconate aldolase/(4S)-4-hydroxy-2-oxoglutarate aldolase
MMKKQNGIETVINGHQIIPVVTIERAQEIDPIIERLLTNGIRIIEVTLRTDFALEGIERIKKQYGDDIVVGAGTVIRPDQIERLAQIGIDFMVSPGLSSDLADAMDQSGIAFLPGVATPSEIIACVGRGYNVLKFFPAELFGGIPALKTYGQVFPSVQFCPTGGITQDTYPSYLSLSNVVSVGGSWMMK